MDKPCSSATMVDVALIQMQNASKLVTIFLHFGQPSPVCVFYNLTSLSFYFSGKSLIPQEALNVPSDWQQQTGSAELISVRPGSAEWDHVQRSLKRSLRAAHVVDIQRVQNKWLYRKYAIQRHLLKDKNGQSSFSLCGSRKYPYPHHGGNWKFRRGGGGGVV